MRVGVKVLLVGLLVGLAGPLLAQSIERTMTPVSTEAEAADLNVLQAELLDPKRRIDTLMGVVAQISDGTCPQDCMMRVPTTDMNPGNLQPWTLNSGWECVWPSEAVNRTMTCPAGWNGGNYTENLRFEIRRCGGELRMVNRTMVGTSPCTREVNGTTRSTPCPTGWTGNYTEQEIITQVLPQPWNMGNILRQSSRWVMVDSTQCSRERIETIVEACPFDGISQTKQRTVRETMAPDLSSVQTSSAGAWSVVPGTECPIPVQDDFGNLCEGSRIRNSWEIVGGCKQSISANAFNKKKKCPWGNVRRCS